MESNVFDNIKVKEDRTFDMNVIIWTKSQVMKNQLLHEPASIIDIQLEKQNAWVISNENSQKFKCEMNLKGTSPGEKVLKLLNELYKCKTLLNEIQYDDMIEGEKIIQLIKKVKTNNN
jgi:hypothetical protein